MLPSRSVELFREDLIHAKVVPGMDGLEMNVVVQAEGEILRRRHNWTNDR